MTAANFCILIQHIYKKHDCNNPVYDMDIFVCHDAPKYEESVKKVSRYDTNLISYHMGDKLHKNQKAFNSWIDNNRGLYFAFYSCVLEMNSSLLTNKKCCFPFPVFIRLY